MANTYTKGQRVRVTGTFADADGTALDPTAVYWKWKDPHGTITTDTHGGAGSNSVKDATGVYHLDIDADVEGTYHYRLYATGTGKAAGEGSFGVSDSAF